MKITDAIEWLKQNGYKDERGSNPEWETHYLYKRTDCTDCNCNERPPNIGFEFSSFNGHEAFSVKIRGEAISGQWVDVGYYSCPIDFVKELSTIEFTVKKMWECAN